ncbi:MAG TPA: zinc-dependent metalloprotease family protein [Pyrinomonadaceae bacterium]|nr:zinc-dependent metalloprotease family protein [Pyrinomonadaceae bacterium]
MRSRTTCLQVLLLFSIFGISFFFDGNSRVRAENTGPEQIEKLERPLPWSSSLVPALTKTRPHEDNLWSEDKSLGTGKSLLKIGEAPKFHRTVSLNEIAQRELLRGAPMEFTKAASQIQVVMKLPMPDGTFARFRVEESPVMEPLLAARFPAIKTYRGRGLDDPTATTRFDLTPNGFHAIVLSTQGTIIIEPEPQGRRGKYVSYNQREAAKEAGAFSCVVYGAEQALAQPSKQLPRSNDGTLNTTSGSSLRTFRLALAATAEFTQQYGGGTVAGALSAITTTTNAVNAIYERDLAIHLTLVANEPAIIFTNTATDGFTSDDPNALLPQNQVVLDQRIGNANYDLGMVLDGRAYAFLPGKFIFQGAANFQSACNNSNKGKAYTILRSTAPTSNVAIYVIAHELAHLLGALHTFNGSLDDCGPSRFAQVAYEPGSGSTIMGYRGGFLPDGSYYPLCADEELHSTDTYFHSASIEQIFNHTSFGSANCSSSTNTGNNPPTVDAGSDYTIPANTPFALTATASDIDGDALTYCWEEFDLGAAGPPHTDNGNRPIFRSFAPATNPTRTFPQLSDILSSSSTFGESRPTTNRTMTFRVTVRDNHLGGGGVNTGEMRVNVVAGAPFAVTQPGSSTTWLAGSSQIVNWNVANTSSGPVNCASVRILLSIDGGSTFPFVLASSTPNSGAATVNIPNVPTTTARIKVEAIDNIFFNISLPNFTISPNSTLAPTLLTEANSNRAIALDSVTFTRDLFRLTTAHNFSLDQRTRIVLFAVGLDLMPGETLSVVTAQAEDATHQMFPVTVESIGKVPNFNWLTQMNIRLPEGLSSTGDVLVSVSLRGAVSNKVVVGIR